MRISVQTRTTEHAPFTHVWRGCLSAEGKGHLPKRLQGSHYSYLTRQAVVQLAAVDEMEKVAFKLNNEMIMVIRLKERCGSE